MSTFNIGDYVKHKQSDIHKFEIIQEWKTSDSEGSSLYECIVVEPCSPPAGWMSAEDLAELMEQGGGSVKTYKYPESELYKVELPSSSFE